MVKIKSPDDFYLSVMIGLKNKISGCTKLDSFKFTQYVLLQIKISLKNFFSRKIEKDTKKSSCYK